MWREVQKAADSDVLQGAALRGLLSLTGSLKCLCDVAAFGGVCVRLFRLGLAVWLTHSTNKCNLNKYDKQSMRF